MSVQMTIPDSMSHHGRVALISGASSGLGELIARLLSASGARVVVGARRQERLAALVDTIGEAGGEALAVPLDVTDEHSVIDAYDAAEAAFGTVDTVVANAGINVESSAVKIPVEDFDAIQAVNSRGVFLTVREAGRRLLKSDDPSRGRVLIVASMGGLVPLPGLAAYCASKAAAVMMAQSFAKEWNRAGICVNALCPGYMLTKINESWFQSAPGKAMIESLPRKRLMPVEAILPSVSHLTCDAGRYMTGSIIKIEDGQLL